MLLRGLDLGNLREAPDGQGEQGGKSPEAEGREPIAEVARGPDLAARWWAWVAED